MDEELLQQIIAEVLLGKTQPGLNMREMFPERANEFKWPRNQDILLRRPRMVGPPEPTFVGPTQDQSTDPFVGPIGQPPKQPANTGPAGGLNMREMYPGRRNTFVWPRNQDILLRRSRDFDGPPEPPPPAPVKEQYPGAMGFEIDKPQTWPGWQPSFRARSDQPRGSGVTNVSPISQPDNFMMQDAPPPSPVNPMQDAPPPSPVNDPMGSLRPYFPAEETTPPRPVEREEAKETLTEQNPVPFIEGLFPPDRKMITPRAEPVARATESPATESPATEEYINPLVELLGNRPTREEHKANPWIAALIGGLVGATTDPVTGIRAGLGYADRGYNKALDDWMGQFQSQAMIEQINQSRSEALLSYMLGREEVGQRREESEADLLADLFGHQVTARGQDVSGQGDLMTYLASLARTDAFNRNTEADAASDQQTNAVRMLLGQLDSDTRRRIAALSAVSGGRQDTTRSPEDLKDWFDLQMTRPSAEPYMFFDEASGRRGFTDEAAEDPLGQSYLSQFEDLMRDVYGRRRGIDPAVLQMIQSMF